MNIPTSITFDPHAASTWLVAPSGALETTDADAGQYFETNANDAGLFDDDDGWTVDSDDFLNVAQDLINNAAEAGLFGTSTNVKAFQLADKGTADGLLITVTIPSPAGSDELRLTGTHLDPNLVDDTLVSLALGEAVLAVAAAEVNDILIRTHKALTDLAAA